jgi:hypothetical protein
VDTLVEVDGVLARYDIFQCATLASLFQTMWCERYGGEEGENEVVDGPSSCPWSRRGPVGDSRKVTSIRGILYSRLWRRRVRYGFFVGSNSIMGRRMVKSLVM